MSTTVVPHSKVRRGILEGPALKYFYMIHRGREGTGNMVQWLLHFPDYLVITLLIRSLLGDYPPDPLILSLWLCATVFIFQAFPNSHPLLLEGLVRTKTFFTLILGVVYSMSKSESSSSPEVRNYDYPCEVFHWWVRNKRRKIIRLSVYLLEVSFGDSRALAASQTTRLKNMEVLHNSSHPFLSLLPNSVLLLGPPETCCFLGVIKPRRSLLGCGGQFRRSLWRDLLHIDWWKHQ